MSRELCEHGCKTRATQQKLRRPCLDNSIARNRGRFAAAMGKASVLIPKNAVVRIPENAVLAHESYQSAPFYAKMGAAKPACPQSRLEKALQFSRLPVVRVRFEADRSIRSLGTERAF